MAKRLISLMIAFACVSGMSFADNSLLKFSLKDGSSTTLAADGSVMTVADGMLLCTSGSDEISLPLENLVSMEFSGDTAGVSGIAVDKSSEPVVVYTISGILLNSYSSLQEAREALAGKTGVYLLKTKSQTIKITVK